MRRGTLRATTGVRRPLPAVVVAALMAAGLSATVLAAGAGGAASSRSSARLVISTVTNSHYGTILVSGRTVYTLKPNAVACTAKCLKYWPEVLLPVGVTHPTAGPGVTAAKLGTLRRAGGRLQVTYGGKALYWFSKDTAAGQVKGNVKDTWGSWSVVVVKPRGGGGGSTTTTAPGGGGGGGAGF